MSDLMTNFGRNEYMKDYYGIDSLVGGTQVNVAAFKSLFPIVVFDVRRH